jgi:hypothetical protein
MFHEPETNIVSLDLNDIIQHIFSIICSESGELFEIQINVLLYSFDKELSEIEDCNKKTKLNDDTISL